MSINIRSYGILDLAEKEIKSSEASGNNMLLVARTAVKNVFQSEDKQSEFLAAISEAESVFFEQDDWHENLEANLCGILRAVRISVFAEGIGANEMPGDVSTGRVFVVHGHDLALRDRVTAWLREQKFQPIVLAEQPGSAKTVIELIEQNGLVDYAICLLTSDDWGGKFKDNLQRRARQNVILEVGYFFARLGRHRVSVIADAQVELPSDIQGLRPIVLEPGFDLEQRLSADMRHAGLNLAP